MTSIGRMRTLGVLVVLGGTTLLAPMLRAQAPTQPEKAPLYPAFPSETPARFAPATVGWDYEQRDVMIPMRDGVKLHTVILVPKGAKGAPILLTRTPYDANGAHQPRAQRAPRADPAAATTTPPT